MMAFAKSLVTAAPAFSPPVFSFCPFFFPLIFLPRLDPTLRELTHLLAFGFPLLAIDVGKIFGLNIALAEEVNMTLALYALHFDLGLVADPHKLRGLLLRVLVMPADKGAMVRVVGIEPTLLAEHDFEPGNWRYPIPIRRHDKAHYQPVSSGISGVAANPVLAGTARKPAAG